MNSSTSERLSERERLTAERAGQLMSDGAGCWLSCSGCYETNQGYPTAPNDPVLKVPLGGGCSECGGIGAIWDTTDYADMAEFILRETIRDEAHAAEGLMAPREAEIFDAAWAMCCAIRGGGVLPVKTPTQAADDSAAILRAHLDARNASLGRGAK